MGANSTSFVRAASAISVIAALSLYPTLGVSSAAENTPSSEDASNTADVRESSEASENPAAISELPASSSDDENRHSLPNSQPAWTNLRMMLMRSLPVLPFILI